MKPRDELIASIVHAVRQKGGPGSGYHSEPGKPHLGRPGEQGGSLPRDATPEYYKPFEPAKVPAKRMPDAKSGLNDDPDLYDSLLFDVNEYLVANDQRTDLERERDSLTEFAGTDPETGYVVSIESIEDNFDDFADEDGNIDYEDYRWTDEAEFKVYMKVYDKNGNRVGRIDFSQQPYREGYLDYIELSHSARNNGFGTRWIEHFEDTFFDRGASVIGLHANIDVGGYYWARIGYDFNDDYYRRALVNALRDTYNQTYSGKTYTDDDGEEQYYDFDYQYDESMFEHSWDIAMFVGPDGRKIGKDVMLGSDWHGVKYAWGSGEEDGYDLGKAYYNERRKKTT